MGMPPYLKLPKDPSAAMSKCNNAANGPTQNTSPYKTYAAIGQTSSYKCLSKISRGQRAKFPNFSRSPANTRVVNGTNKVSQDNVLCLKFLPVSG